MADTIFVKSKLSGDKVALWERDPAHPGGEVFVAGDAVVEVAETGAVLERLGPKGSLEKVARPSAEDRREAGRIADTTEAALETPAEEPATVRSGRGR